MPHANTHEAFIDGRNHARAQIGIDLLADKISFLEGLYQAAERQAATLVDQEWSGYAEGIRHSLNIIKNLGSPLDCYRNIYSPSIPILLEVPPAYKGH
jgi:hypothetical protein